MRNTAITTLIFATILNFASAQGDSASFSNTESQIASNSNAMAESCVSIKAANGAWGSGVIVSKTGLIFSAAHVYKTEGENVTVFMSQGRRAAAQVIRYDRKHDIAVLKLQGNVQVHHANVIGNVAIENGKTLIAAGHASGHNTERKAPLRVGFGFLAQTKGMIYSTCRITAGDSGGPLYNQSGVVCAVHHTMDGKGKYSAHVPVQRFFQLWPELAQTVATV